MKKKRKDERTLQRKVFSKEFSVKSSEEGIPRIWEEFGLDNEGNPTKVCFWGLTYEEGLIARRAGSKASLGPAPEYKPILEPDPDKLPLIYVIMSARAGDGQEYAFNPATKSANTILSWPQDCELLQKIVPSGRIQVLAELVDNLSVVSLSTLIGHYSFFGQAIAFTYGLRSSLLPSIKEALNGSLTEELEEKFLLMEEASKAIEDSAATLLLGSAIPERK